MVDNVIYGPLGLSILVCKDAYAIDRLVVLLLHGAKLFVYLEIVDVIRTDLVVFKDSEQALVALD